MQVFVILCLAAVAFAVPQGVRKALPEEEIIRPPQPYNFAHQVADDETTNYQSRSESQDALGHVQGEYSWVAPNGVRYTTRYSATPEGGFVANTVEEQTSIVVKIPEPYVELLQKQRV